MRKYRHLLGAAATAMLLSFGCAGTVYVASEPPPPQVEVRPVSPGPRAVWIDGHWGLSHGKYRWAPGHWEKNAKGTWVPGHWDKRPRGHVWLPGHWRR